MFNKTVDRAVGTGTRAKLAKAVADNAIWMPVSTCLFFAVLKLAQGQPEEIVSSCQVSKKHGLRKCFCIAKEHQGSISALTRGIWPPNVSWLCQQPF